MGGGVGGAVVLGGGVGGAVVLGGGVGGAVVLGGGVGGAVVLGGGVGGAVVLGGGAAVTEGVFWETSTGLVNQPATITPPTPSNTTSTAISAMFAAPDLRGGGGGDHP